MTGSIGLGLFLNVLFWTVAVLVVVGLGALAVIEWFPGLASRGAEHAAAEPGTDKRDQGETARPYRKAS